MHRPAQMDIFEVNVIRVSKPPLTTNLNSHTIDLLSLSAELLSFYLLHACRLLDELTTSSMFFLPRILQQQQLSCLALTVIIQQQATTVVRKQCFMSGILLGLPTVPPPVFQTSVFTALRRSSRMNRPFC